MPSNLVVKLAAALCAWEYAAGASFTRHCGGYCETARVEGLFVSGIYELPPNDALADAVEEDVDTPQGPHGCRVNGRPHLERAGKAIGRVCVGVTGV